MTPHLAGLANNGKLKIGAHVADEIGRVPYRWGAGV